MRVVFPSQEELPEVVACVLSSTRVDSLQQVLLNNKNKNKTTKFIAYVSGVHEADEMGFIFAPDIASGHLLLVPSEQEMASDLSGQQDTWTTGHGLNLPWPDSTLLLLVPPPQCVLVFAQEFMDQVQLAWTPRPERVRSRLLARDREDARSKLELFGAVIIPEVIDKETIASYMADSTQAILPELKLFIAPSPVKCGCPYCGSLLNPFSGSLSSEARKVYEMVDGLLRLKGSAAKSDASIINDVETTKGGNLLMSKLNAVFQHYFDKKAAKLSHIRRGTAWYSEQHPHKDFSEFTDALSTITCITPRLVELWLGSQRVRQRGSEATEGGSDPIPAVVCSLEARDVLVFSSIFHRGMRQPVQSDMVHGYLAAPGQVFLSYSERVDQELTMATSANFRQWTLNRGYSFTRITPVPIDETFYLSPSQRRWDVRSSQ